MWTLATRWYQHRLERGWERPTPAASAEAFAEAGLTGPFWAAG
jgi:hypothetical protein